MANYSDVIAGLQLFASKMKPDAQIGGADHDIIYGAPIDIELTAEEEAQLEKWGWFKSNEYDSWCRFV